MKKRYPNLVYWMAMLNFAYPLLQVILLISLKDKSNPTYIMALKPWAPFFFFWPAHIVAGLLLFFHRNLFPVIYFGLKMGTLGFLYFQFKDKNISGITLLIPSIILCLDIGLLTWGLSPFAIRKLKTKNKIHPLPGSFIFPFGICTYYRNNPNKLIDPCIHHMDIFEMLLPAKDHLNVSDILHFSFSYKENSVDIKGQVIEEITGMEKVYKIRFLHKSIMEYFTLFLIFNAVKRIEKPTNLSKDLFQKAA